MIGTSPPRPKWEISVTAAANVAATPASTALPPRASMRSPASAAKCRPAATTPTRPTISGRYVFELTIPSSGACWQARSVSARAPRARARRASGPTAGGRRGVIERRNGGGAAVAQDGGTARRAVGLLRDRRARRSEEADLDFHDQEARVERRVVRWRSGRALLAHDLRDRGGQDRRGQRSDRDPDLLEENLKEFLGHPAVQRHRDEPCGRGREVAAERELAH